MTQTKCPICGHKTTDARVSRFIRRITNYTVDRTVAEIEKWVRKNKPKKPPHPSPEQS